MARSEQLVSKAALAEIMSEGGFIRVSKETLRRLGVVRLYDPVSRTYKIVVSAVYGEFVRRVLGIRKAHEGYIFADDLNRMNGLLARENICTHSELDLVDARARTFKRRGIPPIFVERLYAPSRYVYHITPRGGSFTEERNSPSLFPIIDLILQYGAGSYLRHCMALGVQMRNEGKRTKLAIAPATADDVIEFRRRAFTSEGKIDPFLVKEFLQYVEDAFDVSDESADRIRANNERVFAFLETALHNLPHPPMQFDVWDRDPNVVMEYCWYLRFDPADRKRILQAYLGNLRVQGQLRTPQERKAFSRLAALFPDEAAQVARELGFKHLVPREYWYTRAVDDALRTGNFGHLPLAVFKEEPWAADLLGRLEERFRQNCHEAVQHDPMALFTNVSDLFKVLRVPCGVCTLPTVKAWIDDERLRVARALSDEEFARIFEGPRGNKIGKPKYRETVGSGAELAEYVTMRRRQLREAASPQA